MVKAIAYANQKGGVGKSTLCIQQVFQLSEKGHKVLVLDFDGQGNTSSRLAPRIEDEDGSYEPVFKGTKVAELFASECPVIEVTQCPCGADLIHTPINDPDLFEMEAIPLEQAINPSLNLQDFILQYDYVLIDCPPSLGRKLVAALIIATDVVCPVKLSGFAVDGVEGLLNTIIGVQEAYNPELNILGIVINDMDRSVNHSKSLKQLESGIGDLIFENKIYHRSPLDTATTDGIPVWHLRYGHVAAKEVIAVLDEVIQRIG
jgi:chromosome partitioning protein